MAGLVPATHVFGHAAKQVVDARDKRGHDEGSPSPVTSERYRAQYPRC
jgi:hypothetical protein